MTSRASECASTIRVEGIFMRDEHTRRAKQQGASRTRRASIDSTRGNELISHTRCAKLSELACLLKPVLHRVHEARKYRMFMMAIAIRRTHEAPS